MMVLEDTFNHQDNDAGDEYDNDDEFLISWGDVDIDGFTSVTLAPFVWGFLQVFLGGV